MAIRLYTSPVLSIPGLLHGFPERVGGVSTGARASLNLGKRWGDRVEAVEENLRKLAAYSGYDPGALQTTRHVHGVEVWRVGEPLAVDAEFDGMVCDRPGPVLGAFAADCVPILFADPQARVIGAAHAGWRGTVAGIVQNVIWRMTKLGAWREQIRVALGPSIGPCCFEVGPEVVTEFRNAFGDVEGMVVRGPNKDHIDLRVALRTALERAGIAPDQIDDHPPCTKCEPDRFFSYRRDGKDGGVHMAFIAMR